MLLDLVSLCCWTELQLKHEMLLTYSIVVASKMISGSSQEPSACMINMPGDARYTDDK